MSETWPPPGPQEREPLLEHVRNLWQLRGITSNVTAAIWSNNFGHELRVLHDGQLIESRLSRYGQAPLLLIADQTGGESDRARLATHARAVVTMILPLDDKNY